MCVFVKIEVLAFKKKSPLWMTKALPSRTDGTEGALQIVIKGKKERKKKKKNF